MRQIEQLAAIHTRAALRFALIASFEGELAPGESLNEDQQQEYDDACDAMDETLTALVEYVPATQYELTFKARYLLSRLIMGDVFDGNLLTPLLQSIADFRLPLPEAA